MFGCGVKRLRLDPAFGDSEPLPEDSVLRAGYRPRPSESMTPVTDKHGQLHSGKVLALKFSAFLGLLLIAVGGLIWISPG